MCLSKICIYLSNQINIYIIKCYHIYIYINHIQPFCASTQPKPRLHNAFWFLHFFCLLAASKKADRSLATVFLKKLLDVQKPMYLALFVFSTPSLLPFTAYHLQMIGPFFLPEMIGPITWNPPTRLMDGHHDLRDGRQQQRQRGSLKGWNIINPVPARNFKIVLAVGRGMKLLRSGILFLNHVHTIY